MTDIADPAQSLVYSWSAPPIPDESKRVAVFFAATFGLAAIGVVFGVAVLADVFGGDARFLLVMSLILAMLGALGLTSTRNARSFRLAIDRNGTLTAGDRAGHSSVDLRTCHAINVRLRNNRVSSQWSIEAVGAQGAWHREIANVATYWKQPTPGMGELEAELRRWLAWANGGAELTPRRPSPADAETAQTGYAGVVTATPDRFEWRPPQGANADRNRRRVRIGFGIVTAAVAIFAVVSEWENGLAAVFFSMFVPVLLLVIAAGVDLAYRRGKQFAIIVDPTGLTARQGSKTKAHAAHGTITELTVESSTHTSNTGGTTTTSTIWSVRGTAPGAQNDVFRAVIPLHLGTAFSRNDAIALEAELQARCLRPTPGR